MNIILLSLWLIAAGSINTTPPDTLAEDTPTLTVTANELFAIGADSEQPEEYLFDRIIDLSTDSEGNIYVADQGGMTIKVYDNEGTFLRRIGKRGRGPGEFLHLNVAHVVEGDHLIVLDLMQNRITRFSTTGEVLETYTDKAPGGWPVGGVGGGGGMRVLPSGNYLFLERRLNRLLHLFTSDFSDRIASFGDEALVGDLRDPFVKEYSEDEPGRIWVEPSGTILYVPTLYRGSVYRFGKRADEWTRIDRFDGHVNTERAYVPKEVASGTPREEMPEDAFWIKDDETVYAGKLQNESLGVFRMNDGRIIHFSLSKTGDDRTLQAELFNDKGRLLGHAPVDGIELPKGPFGYSPLLFMWKDSNDRFYVVDRETFNFVRVFNIDYELTP